ncbi:virulence RhuM family protein [Nocardiopsis valliformis]|uniref:virulence RhuM family protein n=1 Tax=Nocardiopsis valliformis TaxID=239974 RepID=UPI00034B321C|nr:virulence RhuM family protein [Nocardiopsis valliformis]
MADPHGDDAAVPAGEIILYNTDDGRAQVQLRLVGGTVWLTQAEMADLFDTGVPNINKHIAAILEDGELLEDRTISYQEIVRQEGSRRVRREVKTYNLDMILAVGYRVRSLRGVQFRQWAGTVLTEYLVKGFAMNDERLKEPGGFDYFDELLERIREIRASEKRFYQKVKDVFTTSVDYDGSSAAARTFFATIQNKICYAVTGHTAAELIMKRADAAKPNMGLTTWKGSVVRKVDVTVAKNYLSEEELSELSRLTTMFLDYAEDRARRRQQTTMAQWSAHTDRFLDFNERPLLDGPGQVSNVDMKRAVSSKFDEFDGRRRAAADANAEEEANRDLMAELEKAQAAIEEGRPPHP